MVVGNKQTLILFWEFKDVFWSSFLKIMLTHEVMPLREYQQTLNLFGHSKTCSEVPSPRSCLHMQWCQLGNTGVQTCLSHKWIRTKVQVQVYFAVYQHNSFLWKHCSLENSENQLRKRWFIISMISSYRDQRLHQDQGSGAQSR